MQYVKNEFLLTVRAKIQRKKKIQNVLYTSFTFVSIILISFVSTNFIYQSTMENLWTDNNTISYYYEWALLHAFRRAARWYRSTDLFDRRMSLQFLSISRLRMHRQCLRVCGLPDASKIHCKTRRRIWVKSCCIIALRADKVCWFETGLDQGRTGADVLLQYLRQSQEAMNK